MKIVFKSAENDYYIFTKKVLCWVAWEALMENDRWEAWRCFALKIFEAERKDVRDVVLTWNI